MPKKTSVVGRDRVKRFKDRRAEGIATKNANDAKKTGKMVESEEVCERLLICLGFFVSFVFFRGKWMRQVDIEE